MKFSKDFNSIVLLAKVHLKNLFFDLKKLVLLFFVIVFLMVSFNSYLSNEKKPTIAIISEDNSLQMNMILSTVKNSGISESFKVDIRKKANREDAIFVVEIENDAIKKMETNPPVDIMLSYDKNEPVSAIIKSYVDGLAKFINSTQKSAMLYWDKLKRANTSVEGRLEKLEELSLSIITSFTTRDGFATREPNNTDYTTKFIAILIFIIAMFLNNDVLSDINNGIYERLSINGFTNKIYITSRFIISSVISLIILGLVIYAYNKLLGPIEQPTIKLIVLALIINLLSVLTYINKKYLYLAVAITFSMLIIFETYTVVLIAIIIQFILMYMSGLKPAAFKFIKL